MANATLQDRILKTLDLSGAMSVYEVGRSLPGQPYLDLMDIAEALTDLYSNGYVDFNNVNLPIRIRKVHITEAGVMVINPELRPKKYRSTVTYCIELKSHYSCEAANEDEATDKARAYAEHAKPYVGGPWEVADQYIDFIDVEEVAP